MNSWSFDKTSGKNLTSLGKFMIITQKLTEHKKWNKAGFIQSHVNNFF